MNRPEALRAIFIEEASEIVEKLGIDIIRFEENPSDFDLLNEIFRGVHTLKGNSNAFGFTRLGKFIHSFEDLLNHYRNTREYISPQRLELLVDSVDVVTQTMQCELDSCQTLPQNYDINLATIESIIGGASESVDTQAVMQTSVAQGEKEYLIKLTLDEDAYTRGFDQFAFLRMLSLLATELKSHIDLCAAVELREFNSSTNYIKEVSISMKSSALESDIAECFEFLFDHEYSMSAIAPEVVKVEVVNETTKDIAKEVQTTTQSSAKSTIRIDTQKLDELFDSVGELVIAQNFIAQNEKIHSIEDESILRAIERLSKITRRMQEKVMSLRMVAIRDTFDKMKRVVRDASKKTGKSVNFVIQGEETEIDKTMVDSLSDPLIHIIRNAIDHGLECSGEDRVSCGKAVEGTITLKASHKSGNIVVSVRDDGRGINAEKVLQRAIERGIVTSGDNLSESQIYSLIMQPGFSTAEVISDLSGRGVGLDVVKTAIEKLRGRIEIESKSGEGSTVSLILPLTLAIIDGMLARCADEIYIIPTLSVAESFRPDESIVHLLKGRGEFVSLRGEHIPIVRLSTIFGLKTKQIPPWEGILVCVETENGRVAIMVDELLGRQQVVIKTLGESLSRIKEISGGAILGNGDIALILNIDALMPSEA